MDTLLVLLGVLGFGAIIIAIHVFSADPEPYGHVHSQVKQAGRVVVDNGFRQRKDTERRRVLVVAFPLLINGTLVREERRSQVDRRQPPTT